MTRDRRPPELAASPYRPLHQVVDRATEPTAAGGELRPFGVLLIVLGLLRIIPSVVGSLPADLELAVAVVLLGLGCFVAMGLRRRIQRWAAVRCGRSWRMTDSTRSLPRRAR